MRCRLCGSSELRLFYTQGNDDEYRFYRCRGCRLVNYDLSGGLDQEKYGGSKPDPRDHTEPGNRPQTLSWRFLAEQFREPGRLLDIGCGNGRLLHLARQAGWEVRGLELSPALATDVEQNLGIQVDVGDFLAYAPPDGELFDLVVLRHVLEHLPDGKGALTGIRGLLRDGGRAMLEFPNIDALNLRLKRLLRKTGIHRKRYANSYVPGHANEYCRASFRWLVESSGFDLESWETYSYNVLRNFVYNRLHIGDKARAIIRRT